MQVRKFINDAFFTLAKTLFAFIFKNSRDVNATASFYFSIAVDAPEVDAPTAILSN